MLSHLRHPPPKNHLICPKQASRLASLLQNCPDSSASLSSCKALRPSPPSPLLPSSHLSSVKLQDSGSLVHSGVWNTSLSCTINHAQETACSRLDTSCGGCLEVLTIPNLGAQVKVLLESQSFIKANKCDLLSGIIYSPCMFLVSSPWALPLTTRLALGLMPVQLSEDTSELLNC